MVRIVNVPVTFKNFTVVTAGSPENFQEVSGRELESPDIVARWHTVSLKIKLNLLLSFGGLGAYQAKVTALVAKIETLAFAAGIFHESGQVNFATANVVSFVVRVNVVALEAELHFLTEVVYNVEVVLVARVQVIVDDFSVVNFGPVDLVGFPFHLEDNLGIGFVTAFIHVLEVLTLNENLDNTQSSLVLFNVSSTDNVGHALGTSLVLGFNVDRRFSLPILELNLAIIHF